MNILSNIFLLVISFFKLLSSHYIALIIFSIFVITVIIILSKRKITLTCQMCDNGSWWYKCIKNTGFDSVQCNWHVRNVTNLKSLVDFILALPKKIKNLIKEFKLHVKLITQKWTIFLENILILLFKLHPMYFVYIFILKPLSAIILDVFIGLDKLIQKINISFTIPIIKIYVDIGEMIRLPFVFLIKIIKLLFQSLINIFKMFAKFIYDRLIIPIYKGLLKLFKLVQNTIITLLNILLKKIKKLYSYTNIITDEVQKVDKKHVSLLIIEQVMEYIKLILTPFTLIPPYGTYVGAIINNIYSLTIAAKGSIYGFIIIPVIGMFLGIFSFIMSILYLLVGSDDTNDFRILVYNIFDYFFNFSKK